MEPLQEGKKKRKKHTTKLKKAGDGSTEEGEGFATMSAQPRVKNLQYKQKGLPSESVIRMASNRVLHV